MSVSDLYIMLMIGLVGSIHCAQMCGPIVVGYSLPLARQPRGRQVRAHLLYNLGRVTTYAVLGAVAGAVGGVAGFVSRLAGLRGATTIAAGALMIAAGLLMSGFIPVSRLTARLPFRPRIAARFMQSPGVASKLALGLVLGLLPCGMVYAALLKAVETATPSGGAATMIAFGLGTTSTMVAMGMLSTALGWRLGRYAPRLAALAVTIMGVLLLWRGIAIPVQVHECCH
ncbi:MAG: sulfite exporter TauE/SafE family protein [Acidobacteria bacterium]|nr:sulfite exporter TauE/SafE family protein [Acidobacteriota bacterium]